MSDTAVSAARSRHPRRIDLGGGSWIDVFDTIPPGCRLSPTAFRALWAKAPTERNNIRMYGKVLKEARATQSFIRGYRYANVDHPAASDTVPEELAPLSAWVQRNLAPDTVAFNQVLVNWYDPARGDYIGPHSDNTDGMTPGAPIVSVSYGGTRRFRVSPKVAGLKRLDIMVTNNSMLVMGGNMQQTHTHSITKPQRRDGATSPRINVTFRSFVPHLGP